MYEKAIIFSGPMVRAILEGRKTVTRRALRQQPFLYEGKWLIEVRKNSICTLDDWVNGRHGVMPYLSGDPLWVRESFADTVGMEFDRRFYYKADPLSTDADDIRKQYGVKWRSPIHMPRLASRITLNVTGVKVERLQDISEEEAKAEGLFQFADGGYSIDGNADSAEDTASAVYKHVWQSLHGPCSWDANPWVAAISFEQANK